MPTLNYAVFGQPISHSLSPIIHHDYAKQCGIDLQYTAIESSADDFISTLKQFIDNGGKGGNVTLPLKEVAFSLCKTTSEQAKLCGAVNTLKYQDNHWYGDNTDGVGLIRDITQRHGIDLRGRKTLLIGAGGAARGVASSLLNAGISNLVIVNRNVERVNQLMDSLGDPEHVSSCYWEDLKEQGDFDLIINSTSAGRDRNSDFHLPFHLTHSRTISVDLNYGEAAIMFCSWAKAANCLHILDGLGMLVEQAAKSFEIWHGVLPETQAIYEKLREKFPQNSKNLF